MPAVLVLAVVVLALVPILLISIRDALRRFGAPDWLLAPAGYVLFSVVAVVAASFLLYLLVRPLLTGAVLGRQGVTLTRWGVDVVVPWHDVADLVVRSAPASLSRYGIVGLRVRDGSAAAGDAAVRRALGGDPEALHWVGRVHRDGATMQRVSQLSGGRLERR